MTQSKNQNVFVLGLDEANLEVLHAVPGSEDLTFHYLLTPEELQEVVKGEHP
ncbi:hypothetical protein ACO0LV_09960 [Pseudactinotalea sp. Z1739]|uniref:hypothetical protein n=1 Tax=Pseudactinotalea sp. Z1739 TaxID=3413028 RepID=UPI003C7CD9D3